MPDKKIETKLVKATDFSVVLFEARYCPMPPSAVFLNTVLRPIDCCLLPLAGIYGRNTKVIPTVSIGSDCSRQLL